MGIEIDQEVTVKQVVSAVNVFIKVVDRGSYTLLDNKGVGFCEGCEIYVPSFIPGDDSDYIDLKIDLETGQILNWKTVTKEQIEEFIKVNKG